MLVFAFKFNDNTHLTQIFENKLFFYAIVIRF